jgi:hypothetical protein
MQSLLNWTRLTGEPGPISADDIDAASRMTTRAANRGAHPGVPDMPAPRRAPGVLSEEHRKKREQVEKMRAEQLAAQAELEQLEISMREEGRQRELNTEGRISGIPKDSFLQRKMLEDQRRMAANRGPITSLPEGK